MYANKKLIDIFIDALDTFFRIINYTVINYLIWDYITIVESCYLRDKAASGDFQQKFSLKLCNPTTIFYVIYVLKYIFWEICQRKRKLPKKKCKFEICI